MVFTLEKHDRKKNIFMVYLTYGSVCLWGPCQKTPLVAGAHSSGGVASMINSSPWCSSIRGAVIAYWNWFVLVPNNNWGSEHGFVTNKDDDINQFYWWNWNINAKTHVLLSKHINNKWLNQIWLDFLNFVPEEPSASFSRQAKPYGLAEKNWAPVESNGSIRWVPASFLSWNRREIGAQSLHFQTKPNPLFIFKHEWFIGAERREWMRMGDWDDYW